MPTNPPDRAQQRRIPRPGEPGAPIGAERSGGPGGIHKSQDVTCRWCGGGGHDPHFGGESETCQSCGGGGVETLRRTVKE